MIAHYITNPDSHHGMDALASSLYQNLANYRVDWSEGKSRKAWQKSPSQVYQYACEDADITLRAFHLLKEEIEAMMEASSFYELEMPLMELCYRWNRRCAPDTAILKETTTELQETLLQPEHLYLPPLVGLPLISIRPVRDVL